MRDGQPPTFLCIATFFKGGEFLRECKRQGCRVLLLTLEKLRDANWPHEAIDQVHLLPDEPARQDIIHGVSWLARTEPIDRIVALDEFDLETAAALREHLRIPGMGETAVRYFRDKLAMRARARETGIPVPEFTGAISNEQIRRFLETVPPPWLVKPRVEASAIGIRKTDDPDEVWRTLHELADRASFHLLEQFIPGDVYHVDAIVWERQTVFAEAHQYAKPPFDVMHGGGVFASRTLRRGTADDHAIKDLTRRLLREFGMVRGVVHAEFIKAHDGGRFYFLELAARVGGANIVELVEASTGVNLWREWARIEVADARGQEYALGEVRQDHAGVAICLARQEWPDLSVFHDPEIVWRMHKRHHAGLIVAAPEHARVESLLQAYLRRFADEFCTSLPAPDKPTA